MHRYRQIQMQMHLWICELLPVDCPCKDTVGALPSQAWFGKDGLSPLCCLIQMLDPWARIMAHPKHKRLRQERHMHVSLAKWGSGAHTKQKTLRGSTEVCSFPSQDSQRVPTHITWPFAAANGLPLWAHRISCSYDIIDPRQGCPRSKPGCFQTFEQGHGRLHNAIPLISSWGYDHLPTSPESFPVTWEGAARASE